MTFSKHAEARLQQRGFSNLALKVIYETGSLSFVPGGAQKIFFGKKEYSAFMTELKQLQKAVERAKNGTIIVSSNKIITIYKRK